jgi:electron transfer flavoprotein alpha subunit
MLLLLAEHDNIALNSATGKALTALRQIGGPVHILIAGHQCQPVAGQAAKLGAEKVLIADDPLFEQALAEPVSALIISLAQGYEVFAAPATSSGRNIMPRIAALLDVMQISDVTRVIDTATFERPIYAGNAVETIRSPEPKRVLTIRPSAFAETQEGEVSAAIETVTFTPSSPLARHLSSEKAVLDRPELASARVVVAGGRALGSAENFMGYLGPIADKLKAALGASRAAVDAGYAPNDWQVGQTGKVVAPDLYIAAGISGAIQHLAGMKASKVVVAINKDADAPIFQVADYGLVGDLFTLLPELDKELSK